MKNVYLAQPTNVLSKAVYLPYAVGTIAAYAWQFKEIKDNYLLKELLFLKSDLEETVNSMEDPYLIGFSNYLWNVEYNLELAERIKKKWPDCIIVFGGPQIPDDAEYLLKYNFIDVLIHSEGELPFYKLLSALLKGYDLSDVPGISYREDSSIKKNPKQFVHDLTDFPSPYTSGVFDNIINNPKYAGMQFDVILETNRGCPYNCVYCYWSGNNDPLRRFPMERVLGDLKWFAENKIAYCFCADGNFGIFNRDEEIADYIIHLKNTYGYPVKFQSFAAKEKDDFIFKINKKIHEAGLNNGVSVACQSLSPIVLENIGRKNTSKDKLSKTLKRYQKIGINTYTDIMLGLPGETLESFIEGMFDVIEAGQHYSISVNRCELLPNSLMCDKDYIEKHKIKTIVSSFCQNHSKPTDDDIPGSRSELIVETSTMSRKEWAEACKIACFVQSFHFMGLMRFVSFYLRNEKNISYRNFYMSLYEDIINHSGPAKKIFELVMSNFDEFIKEKSNLAFYDERFGNIYWPHEQGIFLCTVYQFDEVFSELKGYIQKFFDDSELFEDLFNYQKNIICAFGSTDIITTFKYDWLKYFFDITEKSDAKPEKKTVTLKFEPSYDDDWFEYAKNIVWYGKSKNRTIVKPIYIEQ